MGFGYLGYNLHKRKDCQISNLLDFLPDSKLKSCLEGTLHSNRIFLFEFPYEKKCITNIFIWISSCLIDNFMADFSNFIYKDHYLCFKDLCCISEVPDITKSINCHDFFTWNHHIEGSIVFDIPGNKLSASFSKPNSQ